MGSDTVETNDGGIAVTTRDDSCSNTSPTSGSNKRLKVQKKEKKKQMSKTEDVKEDMSWICAECKEAECGLVLHNNKKQKYDEGNSIPVGEGGTAVDDDDSSNDFLICDGPCHRIFHLPDSFRPSLLFWRWCKTNRCEARNYCCLLSKYINLFILIFFPSLVIVFEIHVINIIVIKAVSIFSGSSRACVNGGH